MSQSTNPSNPRDVAIIGMACMFPGAPDVETFWANILGGVDAVADSKPAWDTERYFDPDGAPDERVYTTAGGFLGDLYRFNPAEFGIMPSSVDGGEPDQFLALKVARDALVDAGYADRNYDHSKTGIILGHSTYLHRGNASVVQHGVVIDQTMALLEGLFPAVTKAQKAEVRAILKSKLPPFNTDIAPGLVPNVMTGRIANRLNFKGPNYLIDAACASSLLSVQAAAEELVAGRSDLMLAGGVNASMPAEVLLVFAQLGALSRRARVRPFEAGSDGTLLGEGLGVVTLKRLADARRDGDRVYAVVKGVGQSSDGRGQGLLAPRLEGEILAIRRAYENCGLDPATIGLLEAHGTGIPLGDRTEITALRTVLGERRGPLPDCAIGSVKSMISHCIPAAGVAGLIKSALALYHKVLPPTLCGEVNPELELEATPFYVNTDKRPWIRVPGTPRRAAVNAFGFGGVNTHAILEEPEDTGQVAPLWSSELLIFRAPDRATLLGRCHSVSEYVRAAGSQLRLRDLAFTLAGEAGEGGVTLAVVVSDPDDLLAKLKRAGELLVDPVRRSLKTRTGIYYGENPLNGKLAFVFPGEGAQYQQMLGDLAMCFPVVREWFDFWDSIYEGDRDVAPSRIVFPPPNSVAPETRESLDQSLHGLELGSESMFVASQALHSLLGDFGVTADALVGHSSGENSALVASGVVRLSGRDELKSHFRKLNRIYQQMETAGDIVTGALMTVGAVPRATVLQLVEASGGRIHLALDNCHHQAVLFGAPDDMDEAAAKLRAEGGLCSFLPFDRAYHTPLFEPVANAVEGFFGDVTFGEGQVPVYSCVNAAPMPAEPAAIRHLAAIQWSSRVRFTETVERLYEDGVRYFVEVGPSGNLTSFVGDILRGKEHVAVASNSRSRSGLAQFQCMLARLITSGRDVDLAPLFAGRPCAGLNLAQAPEVPRPQMPWSNVLPYLALDETDMVLIRQALAMPIGVRDSADAAPAGDVVADGDPVEPASGDWRNCPFVERVVHHDADSVTFEVPLDVATQRYLRHHILYTRQVSELDPELHGLSVVPLTCSLEMLAEAGWFLSRRQRVAALENVRAHNWIALDDGQRVLQLSAKRMASQGDEERFHAVLSGDDGMPLVEGEIVCDDRIPDTVPRLPALVDPQPSQWRDDELYATGMFHGPLFHSMRHLAGWDASGMDAVLNDTPCDHFFVDGDRPGFVLNPVLLDGVGHVTAFWLAQQVGTDFSSFPSAIRRIELVDAAYEQTGESILKGRMAFVEEAGRGGRYLEGNYECVDATGRVLFRIEGWRDRFFDVPHTFYQARTAPREGFYGQDWSGLFDDPDRIVWAVPPFPGGFLEDAGAIWKRMLAHTVLSSEERASWLAVSRNPRRLSEWLMGRIALKEAARQWLHAQTGYLLMPADVVIRVDQAGKPYVCGEGLEGFGDMPQVTLAHAQGWTVAAAGGPDRPLGVDLETLGRASTPDLVEGAFTDGERQWVQGLPAEELDEWVMRMWCAKEAAAKHLGVGLNGRPRMFEITAINDQGSSAVVNGEGRDVAITIGRFGEKVVALAY